MYCPKCGAPWDNTTSALHQCDRNTSGINTRQPAPMVLKVPRFDFSVAFDSIEKSSVETGDYVRVSDLEELGYRVVHEEKS